MKGKMGCMKITHPSKIENEFDTTIKQLFAEKLFMC